MTAAFLNFFCGFTEFVALLVSILHWSRIFDPESPISVLFDRVLRQRMHATCVLAKLNIPYIGFCEGVT